MSGVYQNRYFKKNRFHLFSKNLCLRFRIIRLRSHLFYAKRASWSWRAKYLSTSFLELFHLQSRLSLFSVWKASLTLFSLFSYSSICQRFESWVMTTPSLFYVRVFSSQIFEEHPLNSGGFECFIFCAQFRRIRKRVPSYFLKSVFPFLELEILDFLFRTCSWLYSSRILVSVVFNSEFKNVKKFF